MQSAQFKRLPWGLLMRNNLLESETCPAFHRAGQNRPELHKSSSPNVTSCLTSLFSCAVKKWVGNAQQGNLDWVSVQMPTYLDASAGIVGTFGWSLEKEFLKHSGRWNKTNKTAVPWKKKSGKRVKDDLYMNRFNINDKYMIIIHRFSPFYSVKNLGRKSLRTLFLMPGSSRTVILIVVKLIPHSRSWSSQTVFEADQLLHSWLGCLLQASTETNGCRSSYGHSPLGANVRVSHTSFIHDDGRHFASSQAISESIKKAINFERTKRKKMLVLLITVAGSQTQTNHSRIGSIYQRSIQRARVVYNKTHFLTWLLLKSPPETLCSRFWARRWDALK